MKGISFWELHGASWSLRGCSKGSLSPRLEELYALRACDFVLSPSGLAAMNHGLQGCVKSDWAFGSFPQGMGL